MSYRGGGLYCSSVCFFAAFEGPALCFFSLGMMLTIISVVWGSWLATLFFGLASAIFLRALIKGVEGAELQGKYLDDSKEERVTEG